MTYADLKAKLSELSASGATCTNCGTVACYECGRHDESSPGLPCENWSEKDHWRCNGCAL